MSHHQEVVDIMAENAKLRAEKAELVEALRLAIYKGRNAPGKALIAKHEAKP